jgi:hypothetical protein
MSAGDAAEAGRGRNPDEPPAMPFWLRPVRRNPIRRDK